MDAGGGELVDSTVGAVDAGTATRDEGGEDSDQGPAPEPCPANHRVQDGECVPCPAGTVNEAGDDVGNGDSRCDAVLCPADHHVLDHVCTPCAADRQKVAGDDASGADTVCGDRLCGVDERVQSHLCVACATGTTNAAGDNATGSDTYCDDPNDMCLGVLGVPCVVFDEAYIKASNAAAIDRFGMRVALDGDTLAVGAPNEGSADSGINGDQNNNFAARAGAVYVFERDGFTWTQNSYVKASNTDQFDEFGTDVALDGDTLVVGAHREKSLSAGVDGDQADDSGAGVGAAYVFVRDGTIWSQQAYLKAPTTDSGRWFGYSVDVDGDTAVIGEYGDDSANTGVDADPANADAYRSGAAHVYVRNGLSWSHQAYLKASSVLEDDFFGMEVAVDGDTIAVGAPGRDALTGAVYVFTRSGDVWTEEAHLRASNADPDDHFGVALSLDGDTLVVGAYGENSGATGVNGDQSINTVNDSGAVYVFRRINSDWVQEAYIKASNSSGGIRFGISVSVQGDRLAVGGYRDSSASTGLNGSQTYESSTLWSGAAYLFRRTGASWAQYAYIKPSNLDTNQEFGTSLALDQSTLAVGAPGEDGGAIGINGDPSVGNALSSGAVYVRRIAP